MNRYLTTYSLTVAAALAMASLSLIASWADSPQSAPSSNLTKEKSMVTATEAESDVPTHPYVGMWVTRDGYIRHDLLPHDRYDEARGKTKSAYQGRYLVTGNHIDYWDDTGFTADGEFREGILYHAGMVLHRER
jgi:hypothetical protein